MIGMAEKIIYRLTVTVIGDDIKFRHECPGIQDLDERLVSRTLMKINQQFAEALQG